MRDKTAKDAMVPLNDVFMLDINDKMDLLTMNKILTASHSRVPVYDGDKENIIGVLLVKTLITLDPDDKVPIQSLKNTKSWRDVHYIEETKPLYDLLNEYQLGKAHLSVVLAKLDEEEIASATTKQTVLGVITLEDVIEELIQEEIVDETDVYVDIHKRIQVARAKVARNPSLLHKHPRFVERSKSHPPSSAEHRVSEDLIDAVSESHRERAASTGNIQTLPERGTSVSNVQTQDEKSNVDENNTSSDQNHTKDQSDLPLLNKDVT
ncbi:DUF21 domain-containing protein At1g47330 [Lingula anatina]|uniref:DUF21 domain-containing protein At1g47330 n=1 Tax=Lingula anatina TaxID=7574 RepID=A0A1S3JLJ8_LINAN|nr:DUF21 domain-containing protein At1g47330 [Lingula anatina]|eukprot:XP_013411006.1 DUF21 domain-containing protein At1g47330 [Lingula anatina]